MTSALRKWSGPASSVIPTANGAPMRAASAATAVSWSLPTNWATSMTFSGQTTRSVEPGWIVRVACR